MDHGLWDLLTSWENLLDAARKAERGKRFRPDVAEFNARRDPRFWTDLRSCLLAWDDLIREFNGRVGAVTGP